MITADDLVYDIAINDGGSNLVKLATVVDLFENGSAKIQFDGEEEPSKKQYNSLGSFSPSIDDRVLMLGTSGTWVILGSISVNDGILRAKQINVTDSILVTDTPSGKVGLKSAGQIWGQGEIVSDGELRTYGGFRHNGRLAFFGGNYPSPKRGVSDLRVTPTVDNLKSKLNELIYALNAYNLV